MMMRSVVISEENAMRKRMFCELYSTTSFLMETLSAGQLLVEKLLSLGFLLQPFFYQKGTHLSVVELSLCQDTEWLATRLHREPVNGGRSTFDSRLDITKY
ncbi:Uncharacterized protein APZ42_019702 [Daphnia magna]|uniref:Uncharacterized protein n=1 Tax=Daphnia magna TaxID=35525 RepID=A0A162CN98_9CRUS|nr:Uncharacterized protein APZ42_019702 [Daphnia magna]